MALHDPLADEASFGPVCVVLREVPAVRVYDRPRMVEAAESRSPAGDESEAWIAALRATGAERDRAERRLHDLLLRAARFELSRRRAAMSHLRGEEADDIAMQAADDALVAVIAKLDDFRGESRFSTWAYKFALLEAGVRLRRRAWQDREVVLEPDGWRSFADGAGSAQEGLERSELLRELPRYIDEELTAHQRRVFVALALNDVPIDVLAERLSTTRGALYKTLHDARARLRAALAADGHTVGDTARGGRR